MNRNASFLSYWLNDAGSLHYISGSQTVVREGFSGGTRAAFLSYDIRKALLTRFCVIIRSCVMLIRLFAILILSTFEQIKLFWNQACALQH